jgi:hypothetical protein
MVGIVVHAWPCICHQRVAPWNYLTWFVALINRVYTVTDYAIVRQKFLFTAIVGIQRVR